MRITKIAVTLSKTVQVSRFEPVAVTLTQEAELSEGEDEVTARGELYRATSKSMRAMLNKELAHWTERHEAWRAENAEE
jgi:hypothetical protein